MKVILSPDFLLSVSVSFVRVCVYVFFLGCGNYSLRIFSVWQWNSLSICPSHVQNILSFIWMLVPLVFCVRVLLRLFFNILTNANAMRSHQQWNLREMVTGVYVTWMRRLRTQNVNCECFKRERERVKEYACVCVAEFGMSSDKRNKLKSVRYKNLWQQWTQNGKKMIEFYSASFQHNESYSAPPSSHSASIEPLLFLSVF